MKNYLYGFTIYSIQGYIFQTNKLKEIAGASELVEQICTTEFAKMIEKESFEKLKEDPKAIRNAAGNIRYLFDETQEGICKKIVRKFPKTVLDLAPGVQIGQAVVEIAENVSPQEQQKKFKELEQKLTFQRSNPIRPVDLGYMSINRSRRTGLPSCGEKDKDGKPLDIATFLKLKQAERSSRVSELFFGKYFDKEKITTDVEKIVSSKGSKYSWLAVIHADGNNMGKVLKSLENEVTEERDYTTVSKLFSQLLDLSTREAAVNAFEKSFHEKNKVEDIFPFRPIIVGGDDLTIVCRADLALNFTSAYLKEFEEQTKKKFTKAKLNSLSNGLTACAGIAYIKVNYPFHYAVDLAGKLCGHAKKVAKQKPGKNGQVPSCLMFHKVQDSFVESYEDIIERELTAKASNVRFDYGPYYIDTESEKPSIGWLDKCVKEFNSKDGNAIKSGLRQYYETIQTEWFLKNFGNQFCLAFNRCMNIRRKKQNGRLLLIKIHI